MAPDRAPGQADLVGMGPLLKSPSWTAACLGAKATVQSRIGRLYGLAVALPPPLKGPHSIGHTPSTLTTTTDYLTLQSKRKISLLPLSHRSKSLDCLISVM